MKLEQSFEVDAPLNEVWEALVDVEHVAPCIPGAAITGRNEDGSYNGTFKIKIGPTTASYAGRLEMQNLDEAAHTATMHAHGSDRRGQGGATATIVSTLSPQASRTRVEVVTDYHITGRLARFGRGGMIEDISERLLRDFAARLQSSLARGGASDDQPTVEAPAAVVDEGLTVVDEGLTEPAPAESVPVPTEAAAEPAAVGEGEGLAGGEAEGEGASGAPATSAESPGGAPGTSAPVTAAGRASQTASGPAPPPPSVEPAPPIDGLQLAGGVMLDRVRRNPAPVIAVVGGLIAWRILRHRRRRW